MRVSFRASFIRDLRSIRDGKLAARIQQTIEDVEQAGTLNDVPNVKKMQDLKNFYRIRVGEYRIGLYMEHEIVTFLRCLHRRDIYRHFPP
jgi:mRNA interferase RelE/StbE